MKDFKIPTAFIDVILNLFIFALSIIVLLPKEANNIPLKHIDIRQITIKPSKILSIYHLVVFNSHDNITILNNKGKKEFSGNCDKGLIWLKTHRFGDVYIDISKVSEVNSKCLNQLVNLNRYIYFVKP